MSSSSLPPASGTTRSRPADVFRIRVGEARCGRCCYEHRGRRWSSRKFLRLLRGRDRCGSAWARAGSAAPTCMFSMASSNIPNCRSFSATKSLAGSMRWVQAWIASGSEIAWACLGWAGPVVSAVIAWPAGKTYAQTPGSPVFRSMEATPITRLPMRATCSHCPAQSPMPAWLP